ncbi:MAG: hypothetical protein WD016_06605 [Balneolaceae bacterium]
MKYKRVLFVGITVVTVTVILLFLRAPDRQPLEINENVAGIIPQEANERIWVKEPLKKLFTAPVTLYDPGPMKLFNGNLYISDIGDLQIKKLSLDGKLINTIGNGSGRGPGELSMLTNFTKEKNIVWIFDHRTRTVSKFYENGEFIESLIVKAPIGIMAMGDSLIFKNPLSETPFIIYGTDGIEKSSFGSFVANQTDHPLAIDGKFYKKDKDLYYLPYYASYLIRFNKELTPTLLQLIDKTSFPSTSDVKKPSRQVQMFAPNPEIKMSDLSIEGDTASVLSQHRKKDQIEKRIDQYLLPDGLYMKSFSVPSTTQEAIVNEGRVYTLTDTSLVVYKLEL